LKLYRNLLLKGGKFGEAAKPKAGVEGLALRVQITG